MKILSFIALIILGTVSCTQKTKVPNCIHDNSCSPEVYYSYLLSQCKDNDCCAASVKEMEGQGGMKVMDGITQCPDGMKLQMLRCEGSMRWCSK